MNVAFLLVGDNGHAQMASLLVESLRKVMPDARIIQHTDLVTEKVAGVDRVVRLDWKGKLLMTYRLLHLSKLSEPTLVLDADVVVQRDVSELERVPGDVVLASRANYRKHRNNTGTLIMETMPYNTGMMYVRSPAFFYNCWLWCKLQNKAIQVWDGDQLAVAAVAKGGRFNVSVVPGRIYNFSPRSRKDKNLRRAAIVHYKGAERKKWMLESAV